MNSSVGVKYRWGASFLLAALGRRAERAWNVYLAEQGISTAQFATMAALAEGERTQTQVAAATAVDPRNMGPTIRKLIDAGWVQARSNPDDARSRLLSLSVAGKAWWDAAQPHLRRGREQFFRALTSGELATLEALLGKLEASHSRESTSASN